MIGLEDFMHRLPNDVGGQPSPAFARVEHALAPWEKRCHALADVLDFHKIINTEEKRRGVEALGEALIGKMPYYERWIVAFANILFAKGILTPTELAQKMREVEARMDAERAAAPHDRLHRVVVARLAPHDGAPQAHRQRRLLGEEHGQERLLGHDRADLVPDDLAQLLRGRRARGADSGQAVLDERHRAVKDRREQILLRAEVAVERLLRDAEPARQLLERRRAIAARAEQFGGGGEDLGPHQRAARGAETQWWQATQSSGACMPRVAFCSRWHSMHQPIDSAGVRGRRPTTRIRSSVSRGPVSAPTTGMRSIGP